MLGRVLRISAALLAMLALPASAADPFAEPVTDCRPCRFSPGPGQPEFNLSFVFEGGGDQRALVALDITSAGGHRQRLEVSRLEATDFPDGFILDASDVNFDALGDLSIATQLAANNINAAYWVYQPETHGFAPLERVNDDGIETRLSVESDRRLSSHVLSSAIEYTDYSYRVAGHRAVAVSKNGREIDGNLIIEVSYDLTVQPAREVQRAVVGFSGDSPARRGFLRRLDTASAQAEKLYRGGDAAGAAAVIAAVVKDLQLGLVTSAYPIEQDPSDLRLVRHFNDYGFYLERSNQTKRAVDALSQVTDVAPDRTIAYLNLGDAQYAAGQTADAKATYAEFRRRMAAAGKQAELPPRVAERLR